MVEQRYAEAASHCANLPTDSRTNQESVDHALLAQGRTAEAIQVMAELCCRGNRAISVMQTRVRAVPRRPRNYLHGLRRKNSRDRELPLTPKLLEALRATRNGLRYNGQSLDTGLDANTRPPTLAVFVRSQLNRIMVGLAVIQHLPNAGHDLVHFLSHEINFSQRSMFQERVPGRE
jgi:hypothetical protein